ncbi:MAG: hypothetical protein ACI9G1_005899, partial [Pirellulaceae bacterium]
MSTNKTGARKARLDFGERFKNAEDSIRVSPSIDKLFPFS